MMVKYYQVDFLCLLFYYHFAKKHKNTYKILKKRWGKGVQGSQ